MFQTKRIYESPVSTDGFRVLVDRLWPRGISKAKAALDLWLKDIAPSDELRHWYNHEPEKWPEFQKRYAAELKDKTELLTQLKNKGKGQTVTLLFGSKELERNNAVALLKILNA